MAEDGVSCEPVSELPVTWEPDEKCRRPANDPEARRSQSHSQKACGDQQAQLFVCFSTQRFHNAGTRIIDFLFWKLFQSHVKSNAMIKSLLICLYLLASNVLLYDVVFVQVGHNSTVKMLFFVTYFVLFSIFFTYCSFFSNRSIKVLCFAPLIISGITGQYYWIITGQPISIDAIDVALVAHESAIDLLREHFKPLLMSIGTAIIGIAGILLPNESITVRLQAGGSFARVARKGVMAMVTVMIIGSFGLIIARSGYGVIGMPVQVTSLLPLPLTQISSNFTMRDDFTYSYDNISSKSILIIIDESTAFDQYVQVLEHIRSDVLPMKDKADILTFLDTAKPFYTTHNCSAQSVWGLVNGLKIIDGGLQISPSLWRRAKTADFTTAYISSQELAGQHQYLQTTDDIALMDERYYFGAASRPERDRLALRQALALLGRSEPMFILLIKNGSHFPYDLQIRHEVLERFASLPAKSQRERSYLLSIYENTFRFLAELFRHQQVRDSRIFYLSDHGQDLSKSGFSHCNSDAPKIAEWKVPMLLHNVRKPPLSNMELYDAIVDALGFRPTQASSISAELGDVMIYGSLNNRLCADIKQYRPSD